MKTITLEEHFFTTDFLAAAAKHGEMPVAGQGEMQARLLDLGAGRINAMDEGGVDLQVLSLAALGLGSLPAEEETAVLRGVHDELAAAVRAHPRRLAGFCTPALKEPKGAAKELERCVRELGFKGMMADGTVDGKFLDAPEFLPVWEAAAALDVPVYLHPAPPPAAVAEVYYSGLPGEAGQLLSIAGWGWHAETGLHILRLISAGLFDRFPKLQVIIGHMGEMLPYALERSSSVLSRAGLKLQRSVAETFREQVHVTTSGYFTRPPFECARAVLGLDRLMYSVDYPFSPNTQGRKFLEAIALEGPELEWFTHGHAESLLKL